MIKEKPSHKFFERYVDNDLTQLSTYLLKLEKDLFDGVYPKVSKEFANNIGGVHNLGTKFNIFQCYNPQIHKLFSTLRDLTIEACEYYNIDYKKQSYMVQGWFNTDGIAEPPVNESTHYHDHLGGTGVPNFHGYYCVDAEPSFTYYKIGVTCWVCICIRVNNWCWSYINDYISSIIRNTNVVSFSTKE